jgi:hypothetical protein
MVVAECGSISTRSTSVGEPRMTADTWQQRVGCRRGWRAAEGGVCPWCQQCAQLTRLSLQKESHEWGQLQRPPTFSHNAVNGLMSHTPAKTIRWDG